MARCASSLLTAALASTAFSRVLPRADVQGNADFCTGADGQGCKNGSIDPSAFTSGFQIDYNALKGILGGPVKSVRITAPQNAVCIFTTEIDVSGQTGSVLQALDPNFSVTQFCGGHAIGAQFGAPDPVNFDQELTDNLACLACTLNTPKSKRAAPAAGMGALPGSQATAPAGGNATDSSSAAGAAASAPPAVNNFAAQPESSSASQTDVNTRVGLAGAQPTDNAPDNVRVGLAGAKPTDANPPRVGLAGAQPSDAASATQQAQPSAPSDLLPLPNPKDGSKTQDASKPQGADSGDLIDEIKYIIGLLEGQRKDNLASLGQHGGPAPPNSKVSQGQQDGPAPPNASQGQQ